MVVSIRLFRQKINYSGAWHVIKDWTNLPLTHCPSTTPENTLLLLPATTPENALASWPGFSKFTYRKHVPKSL